MKILEIDGGKITWFPSNFGDDILCQNIASDLWLTNCNFTWFYRGMAWGMAERHPLAIDEVYYDFRTGDFGEKYFRGRESNKGRVEKETEGY